MASCGSSRLFWKLWRESRGLLPALIAIPAAGFTVAALLPDHTAGWQMLRMAVGYATAYMVPVMAGIMAATLAEEDWSGGAFAPSHLPLRTADIVGISFVAPLVVAAILGLWTGWWVLVAWAISGEGPGTPLFAAEALGYYGLWALLSVACFATGYVVSAAGTRQLGTVVAALMANIGPTVLINMRNLTGGGRRNLPNSSAEWVLLLAFAAAPIAATFAWAWTRRKPRLRRQYAASGAGAVTLAVMIAPALLSAWATSPGSPIAYLESQDGSLIVHQTGQFGGPKGSGTYLRFANRRNGASAESLFPLFVQPLGFAGSNQAILATREGGEPRMTIRRWSLESNRVEEVVTIPYSARAQFALGTDNTYKGGFAGWVRPDGRWMLLRTRPSNGSGVDLWLLDIEGRDAKIVFPNYVTFRNSQVSWLGDRAILSGEPPQIEVDLVRMAAHRYAPEWEDAK